MTTSGPKKVRLKNRVKTTVSAWKLLRLRADRTLGPLFINRKLVIPLRRWLRAEDHPTPGYAHRPGWHAAPAPHAPHLSDKGRVWCQVRLRGWVKIKRPAIQGGAWFLAEAMFVEHVQP
jgi:hypothetical protein